MSLQLEVSISLTMSTQTLTISDINLSVDVDAADATKADEHALLLAYPNVSKQPRHRRTATIHDHGRYDRSALSRYKSNSGKHATNPHVYKRPQLMRSQSAASSTTYRSASSSPRRLWERAKALASPASPRYLWERAKALASPASRIGSPRDPDARALIPSFGAVNHRCESCTCIRFTAFSHVAFQHACAHILVSLINAIDVQGAHCHRLRQRNRSNSRRRYTRVFGRRTRLCSGSAFSSPQHSLSLTASQ